MSSSTTHVKVHVGKALEAASKTYSSLPSTLVEMIGNALDAHASRVVICVDRVSNKVYVLDNGTGINRTKFETSLQHVFQSNKSDDQLGEFGRGLISPLCKCEYFVVSSVPKEEESGHEWTFVRDKILASADGVDMVGVKTVRQLLDPMPNIVRKACRGDFAASYRTMITMNNVVVDRSTTVIDFGQLEYDIKAKLSRMMLKFGTIVRFVELHNSSAEPTRGDITPLVYKGEPLEEVEYQYMSAGAINIKLYRSRTKSGIVGVLPKNRPQPVTMNGFRTQAMGRKSLKQNEELGLKEALDALSSGFFEGLITAEHIQLDPDRDVLVISDALDDLYLALCQWWDEHGSSLFKSGKEESREVRYRELSQKSVARLLPLLQHARFEKIRGLLLSPLGSSGIPGLDLPNKERLKGRSGGVRIKNPNAAKPTPKTPPNHSRNKGSIDLFEHDTLPGSTHVWEFDEERSKLIINIRHPLWVKMDETNGKHLPKNAKMVLEFQIYLALQVLSLYNHFDCSPVALEAHRSLIDSILEIHCDTAIINPPK